MHKMEVGKKMPFGMGPLGFFMLPYLAPYRYRWPPAYPFPWLTYRFAPFLYPPFITKEEELRMLEEESKLLEQELAEIKKRIEELKK